MLLQGVIRQSPHHYPSELFVTALASRYAGSAGDRLGFAYLDYYPTFIGGMPVGLDLNSGARSPHGRLVQVLTS